MSDSGKYKGIKVIVAPDSYKGCISSMEVAHWMALGVEDALPGATVIRIPVADGGEGTAGIIGAALGMSKVVCATVDPLGRDIESCYYMNGDLCVADVASAGGIGLLKPEEYSPLVADSYGTGKILRDAFDRGCREIYLGLGGSATVDGGVGLARAFGVRFSDAGGREALRLCDVYSIDFSGMSGFPEDARIRLMADVVSPLTGPRGAAAVFGPQKGASVGDVRVLDSALSRLASLAGGDAQAEGTGAAGGIGFMMKVLAQRAGADAAIVSGAKCVLDLVGFDTVVKGATLVLTGEGHSELQTLLGKIPAEVLSRSLKAGATVALLSGGVDNRAELMAAGFSIIRSIHPPGFNPAESMQPDVTRCHLRQTACSVSLSVVSGMQHG